MVKINKWYWELNLSRVLDSFLLLPLPSAVVAQAQLALVVGIPVVFRVGWGYTIWEIVVSVYSRCDFVATRKLSVRVSDGGERVLA